MAYRIAICDDNQADRDYIGAQVSAWAAARNLQQETQFFSSAEHFLFQYEDQKNFDILLLDIEMTGQNGVELAKTIRAKDRAVQILFITGHSDYIADGYEVEALHYLMKPVDKAKLFSVLDRAVEKLQRNERALFLDVPDGLVRVPLHEIAYLEVQQNYVTVHADEDYTVRSTLGDLERELDESFFRAGRSYIVNLRYIRRISKTEVLLKTGAVIPIPKSSYEPLNRAFIQYF
ncbi:MAG: response regulator transcription factor [Ruminococcaceae bacterium]|nr:response regulator transcription factor [Oscillospiraceae bacterium]